MSTAVGVRERPIIMRPESVRALLAGPPRKTETRRVIKPQPRYAGWGQACSVSVGSTTFYSTPELLDAELRDLFRKKPCPYGQVGDRLWVRETFAENSRGQNITRREWEDVYALLDLGGAAAQRGLPSVGPETVKWTSPIFMPRKFSRITRTIACVRCERLQDITFEGIRAEGYEQTVPRYSNESLEAAHDWFVALWDSINAKRGCRYSSNPWVWVIGMSPEETR